MPIQRIRPHLYRLLLGRYQAYLWSDDDGPTRAGSGPESVSWRGGRTRPDRLVAQGAWAKPRKPTARSVGC